MVTHHNRCKKCRCVCFGVSFVIIMESFIIIPSVIESLCFVSVTLSDDPFISPDPLISAAHRRFVTHHFGKLFNLLFLRNVPVFKVEIKTQRSPFLGHYFPVKTGQSCIAIKWEHFQSQKHFNFSCCIQANLIEGFHGAQIGLRTFSKEESYIVNH